MAEKNLQIFARLIDVEDKAELAGWLFDELAGYSVFDLQAISANLEREIAALPSPYRERVRPYFIEQFFLRYSCIMALRGQGVFAKMREPVKDRALFRDYCQIAAGFRPEDEGFSWNEPFHRHFYYVVSAFFMFVLDEPGHPVGMPFPGGFKVEKRPDGFYCPIRDKEKDVVYSICNFCPAKQSRLP